MSKLTDEEKNRLIETLIESIQISLEEKRNEKLKNSNVRKELINFLLEEHEINNLAWVTELIKLDKDNDCSFNLNCSADLLMYLSIYPTLDVSIIVSMIVPKYLNKYLYSPLKIAELTLEVVALMAQSKVLDVVKTDFNDSIKVSSNLKLNTETVEYLKDTNVLLPMLLPPKTKGGKGNRNAGYLTNPDESIILGDYPHDLFVDRKVLDILNNIAFNINLDVAEFYQSQPKEGSKATPEEIVRQLKTQKNNIETLIKYGNVFYFSHKYEKRGRMFSTGYTINYQGDDFQKAVIELKNKKVTKDEII